MRKYLGLLALLLVLLLTFACAPSVVPASAPAPVTPPPKAVSPAPAAPLPTKAAWEEQWGKWVEGAKKEGKLVVYCTGGVSLRTALSQAFKERFGIDMEIISGRGAEVAEKLKTERRAGLYLVDVYIGGSTTVATQIRPAGILDPLKPVLILPEVLDPSVWRGGEMRFLDAEKRYSLALTTYSSPSIAVNTDLVKPGEIKGYRDILNPKWKGKILLNDPTKAGTGSKQFGVVGSRILDWDYWKQMVKQEPTIVTDQRLMVDWLAHGKYAVLIGLKPEIVQEFVDAGAPLSYVRPIEGSYLTSGTGTLSLINQAPHPNAARLFANWLCTKDGSAVLSQALGVSASRLDVPTEGLDPALMLKPGEKYFVSDDEEFTLEQPKHYELAKEIFGSLSEK